MSNRPPHPYSGPFDHLAMRYLRRALDTTHPTDEPFVLHESESVLIRRTVVVVGGLIMLAGLLTIVLFYGPQFFWPSLFIPTVLPALGVSLPLLVGVYALLLLYIQLHVVLSLTLLAAKAIMHICHFPYAYDAQYSHHLQQMKKASTRKLSYAWLRLDPAPFLTLPRWGLYLFVGLNLLGAFGLVAGLVWGLQPYLATSLLWVSGALVYAAWSAYVGWQIMHETKIRVMAPLTVRSFVNELREEWRDDESFRSLIPNALHYAGLADQQHHYAHLLLAETFTDRFCLSEIPPSSVPFIDQMAQLPPHMQQSFERILIFAMLIDGHFTRTEKKRFRALSHRALTHYTIDDLRQLSRDYTAGRGLWV